MSGLRKIGGLAHLARCTCTATLSASCPTHNAHWSWGWAVHITGLQGPAANPARHNSTLAANPASTLTLPSNSNSIHNDTVTSMVVTSDTVTSECIRSTLSFATPHDHLAFAAAAAPEGPGLSLLPPFPCISAASPLEDPLALVLSPTQLGAQLWEGAHTATGLPWWAAIPITTLLLRGALMPLSLRAYAASANVALLHQAFGLSRSVAEAVAAVAEEQRQMQRMQAQKKEQREEEQQLTGKGGGEHEVGSQTLLTGSSSGGSASSSSGSSSGGSTIGVELGRLDLVRRVFAHLRHQHGVPSFGWYMGNATVQVSLMVSLSLALRRMSDSLWPGLTGEGLLYFQDLTAPPMYLQTLSTPYGTAGAILPLALVLLYVSAADRSAGGSSPGIHMALKLLVLPLYCAALLQPHAVLLYWMAQAASQLGMYEMAARLPPLRRAARVPELLLAPRSRACSDAGPSLDELLFWLSESYVKVGNTAAARLCLEALLTRQPLHQQANERLQALSSTPALPQAQP